MFPSEYGNLPRFVRGGDHEKPFRKTWVIYAHPKYKVDFLLRDGYRVAKLRRYVERINPVRKDYNKGAYDCMRERKAV